MTDHLDGAMRFSSEVERRRERSRRRPTLPASRLLSTTVEAHTRGTVAAECLAQALRAVRELKRSLCPLCEARPIEGTYSALKSCAQCHRNGGPSSTPENLERLISAAEHLAEAGSLAMRALLELESLVEIPGGEIWGNSDLKAEAERAPAKRRGR